MAKITKISKNADKIQLDVGKDDPIWLYVNPKVMKFVRVGLKIGDKITYKTIEDDDSGDKIISQISKDDGSSKKTSTKSGKGDFDSETSKKQTAAHASARALIALQGFVTDKNVEDLIDLTFDKYLEKLN